MKQKQKENTKRNAKQNNRHAFGFGNGKIGKKQKRIERIKIRIK